MQTVPYRIGFIAHLPSRFEVRQNPINHGDSDMSWKSPKIVEIALGAEINSYACAEAKK